MPRQRQNTEQELNIIQIAHNTRLRVGRPSCKQRVSDLVYSLIYNKYYWNSFTFFLFVGLRLLCVDINVTQVSIFEWYNDTMFFVLANNYLFKRLHWNNGNRDYYNNTNIKYAIVPYFLIVLIVFTIWSERTPTFYITKESVYMFDDFNKGVFILILLYTFGIQVWSCRNLYRSVHRQKLLSIHAMKYCVLLSYFFLDKILIALDTNVQSISDVENNYHIHHWFCGIVLLFLTELPQPYHTFIQYLHYSVYLHGCAVYGYDTILQ